MNLAIWWVRRDLRLSDNPALRAALQHGRVVLPVFILDPSLLEKPAPNRQAFLFAGLRQLDADLNQLGSYLLVRAGNPLDVLTQVVQESGAEVIVAGEDYSPYARQRDAAVKANLPLELVLDVTVFHPGCVLKPDGSPYVTFTPFSKVWKALPKPGMPFPAPEKLASAPQLDGVLIPQLLPSESFPPGEQEAQRRLTAFLSEPVYAYAEDRNLLDLPGTSQLSPYLRFGMLSARQAATAVMSVMELATDADSRHGCEVWLNELIWREFYNSLLFHFPSVLTEAYTPSLRKIPWRDVPADLHAWQVGLTGYPVVDAAMRQLSTLGWMHNRARMIVASFLVKDLLINWQEGEHWFMRHLVDGDPAANNGGWQWTAGVGTDAAPYFRIFNPVLQGIKFDPAGDYIRRWVPELRHFPTENLHAPWLAALDVQQAAGCRIGKDYPGPIVEHAIVKERTLRAFQFSKEKI